MVANSPKPANIWGRTWRGRQLLPTRRFLRVSIQGHRGSQWWAGRCRAAPAAPPANGRTARCARLLLPRAGRATPPPMNHLIHRLNWGRERRDRADNGHATSQATRRYCGRVLFGCARGWTVTVCHPNLTRRAADARHHQGGPSYPTWHGATILDQATYSDLLCRNRTLHGKSGGQFREGTLLCHSAVA